MIRYKKLMSETNTNENEVATTSISPKPELGMVDETQVTYANLPIVMSQADMTWQHYGHILAPIAFRNRWEKLDTRSGYYLWMQQTPNPNNLLANNLVERKILRDSQTFLPHEEVQHQLTEVFERELAGSGLHITDKHHSHHGDTMHWTILSDKLYRNIENSYIGKDDIVKFGAVVRNGIGTNVALGVDLYTYRLVCENGAIARGRDLGSFSISHARRKDMKIQDAIVPAITECVGHLKEFTEYYQQATKIKFNQKIMNELTKRVWPSDKMLPNYIEVDYDLRRKRQRNPNDKELQRIDEFKVTPKGRELDMWNVFNDFTENYWHSNKMSFHRISQKEQALHTILIKAVQGRI